jgi:hypothetical protein
MSENVTPGSAIHEFERTYLAKLRLAAQVILEAAPDWCLVPDPLEVELGIFKDRVEFMLLLPEAPTSELPWRGDDNDASRLSGPRWPWSARRARPPGPVWAPRLGGALLMAERPRPSYGRVSQTKCSVSR